MRRLVVAFLILAAALVFMTLGCGGSGGSGDGDNTWNSMNWNRGTWGP